MTAECVVVMYHYVRDTAGSPFPRLNARSVADFVAQLEWLERRHEITDHARLVAALDHRRLLAASSALLTFDDGFVDHYEAVFPVLRAKGLSGIFFVSGSTIGGRPRLLNVHKTHFLIEKLGGETFAAEVRAELEGMEDGPDAVSRWPGIYRLDTPADLAAKRLLNYELPFSTADLILERMFGKHIGDSDEFARSLYLSPGMIAEMARGGMSFGFHTHGHRVLSRLSRKEQTLELGGGVGLIRALTNQDSVSFCYPYGLPHTYNADTLQILAAEGYSMAFNTVRRRLVDGREGRYELPRFDTRDLPTVTGAAEMSRCDTSSA